MLPDLNKRMMMMIITIMNSGKWLAFGHFESDQSQNLTDSSHDSNP